MSYICEICDFKCDYLANWNKHILTSKHNNNGKTIKKETRNKYCNICGYKALTYSDARNHYLSKHGTTEEKKKEYPYYCNSCNIGTFGKCIYKAHCKTNKHLQCSIQP
jgi:hypothetical protein